MKNTRLFIALLFATVLSQHEIQAQTKFELEPSQNMLMTGKGQGQDGAVNPFYGQDCYAVVENIGKTDLSARIQKQGKIIKTIAIKGGEKKKFKLLKGQELYFDANDKKKVKVMLDFEKMEN